MSITHEYIVGVALSESLNINNNQRPLGEKTQLQNFRLTKNLIISETVHHGRIVTIKHWSDP